MTNPHYGVTHEVGAAFATTIPAVRWLEPEEFETKEAMNLHNTELAHFRYYRDTSFAGNSTEAVSVFKF